MKNFVLRHWRGEYSPAKSFFRNLILGYFAFLLLGGLVYLAFAWVINLFIDPAATEKFLTIPGLLIVILFAIWGFVGVIRSCLKGIRSGMPDAIGSSAILIGLVVVLGYLILDVWRL